MVSRRFGDFDGAEDATQEALIAAARRWPEDGVPEEPHAWLIRAASRRLVDAWRSDTARREREARVVAWDVPAADAPDRDDSLTVLFLCCHPSLTPASAIALTLRAVGGLTTAEIARAFLVPESTMAQRISRAKTQIRQSGEPFRMPSGTDRDQRLRTVLHVLYLVFNEGYTGTRGEELQRVDLCAEAIRLTRLLVAGAPDEPETMGLLALLLLLDARRAARTDDQGRLVPLPDQDRSGGTPRSSQRASTCSDARWPTTTWGSTSSKPPSRPFTTGLPRPVRRTGARSARSTNFWKASRETQWSRSTGRWRSRRRTVRTRGCGSSTRSLTHWAARSGGSAFVGTSSRWRVTATRRRTTSSARPPWR